MFLAGLIFLNQLQAETDKQRLNDFIEDLKTIFSFLGAMRSYFVSAQTWVHTLLRIHSLSPLSETEALQKALISFVLLSWTDSEVFQCRRFAPSVRSVLCKVPRFKLQ